MVYIYIWRHQVDIPFLITLEEEDKILVADMNICHQSIDVNTLQSQWLSLIAIDEYQFESHLSQFDQKRQSAPRA